MSSALTIILIEDHRALRLYMSSVLQQQGHQVTALECAEDLDGALMGQPVDLFVLDLNLPGEDGISLARRIRTFHPSVGIIMITALAGARHMTAGYSSGADIYLHKPVEPETLLAAVSALSRRLLPQPEAHRLQLDPGTGRLSGPGGSARLQEHEVALLTAFLRTPGRRLETGQIGELMGHSPDTLSKAGIEVRIARLRKKLLACGAEGDCIRALRTVGYQLCETIRIG